MKGLLKVVGFAEWIAFIVFVVVLGASQQSQKPVAAILVYAVAVAMLWFMIAASSRKRAKVNRFPNCIPVGNPVVYALLGYFCYEASVAEALYTPLLIAISVVVGIGILRWVISMMTLD